MFIPFARHEEPVAVHEILVQKVPEKGKIAVIFPDLKNMRQPPAGLGVKAPPQVCVLKLLVLP